MSSSPSYKVLPIPWPVLRVILIRFAMLAIVIGSCALVWWSISRRLMPATLQVREKSQAMALLANEVQQLEAGWNGVEAEQTDGKFKRARSRLFTSNESLLTWQRQTERQADALALQPSAQPGQPRAHPAAKLDLSLLPLTVDIRPREIPRSTNTAYRRLLHFARALEAPDKRIDVTDLSVTASSNSMQQVTLVLNVWTPETPPP
jgi:hypothetical protein